MWKGGGMGLGYYEEFQYREHFRGCAKCHIYSKQLSIQNLFCQLLSIHCIVILQEFKMNTGYSQLTKLLKNHFLECSGTLFTIFLTIYL